MSIYRTFLKFLYTIQVVENANFALTNTNHYYKNSDAIVMRSSVLFFIITFLACGYLHSQKYIESGAVWPDNNGQHINAHGGGSIYYKNKYYWYGESKDSVTNTALQGVSCYSSSDFVKWKNEGVVLKVVDSAGHDIERGCIIERPKVIYNEKTKKFVMWFHLELKGQGYKAARAALAVSDSPTGPFVYKYSYRPNKGFWPMNFNDIQKENLDYTKPALKAWSDAWKKAVQDGYYVRRDFAGGQMSRDMTLFVDDDAKAYHIYSSEDNLTLQISLLTDDYCAHTGKYIRVAPAGHNEAPTIFKQNGTYWMITSGCTGWAPNEARMFKANSIWGPWEQLENPCVGPDANLTFKSQGTYIQKLVGKTPEYVFMADRWTPKFPSDGRYIWIPIIFENNHPVLRWDDKWSPKKQ